MNRNCRNLSLGPRGTAGNNLRSNSGAIATGVVDAADAVAALNLNLQPCQDRVVRPAKLPKPKRPSM